MKALTLWQPWASLIAIGAKTIETRGWSTSYRGPLAIHAAQRAPKVDNQYGWVGDYMLGLWAPALDHVDPCDCDEDGEVAGDRCMARSHPAHALFSDEGAHGWSLATTLPLGAVVATCRLVDVAPMIDLLTGEPDELLGRSPALYLEPDTGLCLSHHFEAPVRHIDVSDQRPYGDFAPGRFAWLLEDIEPLAEPIPATGRQGLWEWEPAHA